MLTLLVVAIGLSLAATESRDERDVLVAVGAKPRTLRGLAGTKAVVLTVGAAFLAIPTGFIPVAAVITAADGGDRLAFPWLTALGLLVLVPALAGVAALCASGDRPARPPDDHVDARHRLTLTRGGWAQPVPGIWQHDRMAAVPDDVLVHPTSGPSGRPIDALDLA